MNSNWELKRIDEVADVVSGGTPSREVEEFWNGNINWATPTDITRDSFRTLKTTKEKITKKGLQGSSAKLLPPGTLLMTSRATLVEIKIAETEVCTNQGFKSLVPFSSVDRWFLFYQMKNHKSEYERYGIGTTFLEVNKYDTDRFTMPFPKDKRVQTKIAKILITIDNVIEKTEAAIAKYEAIKEGMMQDLFTRGIGADGKLRPKFEDSPELYKPSELGWIPKDWGTKELLKSTYMKGRIGWQGLKASEFIEEGPYLVTGTDFKEGKVVWNTCYHVSQARFEEAKYIHLQEEDLLITKDGTIGKTAVVENCPEQAVLNSGIFLLRCKDGSYRNRFLYYILNHEIFYKFLRKTQGGSTINHLYQREFEKFEFPLPEPDEQDLILERLMSIDDRILGEKENLVKQQNIKQGLMQDLLTGKIEVKVDKFQTATTEP